MDLDSYVILFPGPSIFVWGVKVNNAEKTPEQLSRAPPATSYLGFFLHNQIAMSFDEGELITKGG